MPRMPLEAPQWWSRRDALASRVLAPASRLYGLGVRMRFALTTPYRSSLPVICIGNFTMGGGGKTPLAIALGKMLIESGLRPVYLTRGYGGRICGPHIVDVAADDAGEVGDEPLLLAEVAPVVVSADRPAGARCIERMAADVIVMDDGFQNPTLEKDFSIIAVDSAAGFGNERVFPAGPLRAPLSFQLPKADVIVAIGHEPSPAPRFKRVAERSGKPVLRAELVASQPAEDLKGKRVTAATGIARPGKFFDTLQRLGADIAATHAFPDHHVFSDDDAAFLLREARRQNSLLVLTRKDWVRLPDQGACGELRQLAVIVDVELRLDDPAELTKMLAGLGAGQT